MYRTNCLQRKLWTCTGTLAQSKQQKRDIRFSTWNVRILYWSGSLTVAARELTRYKLDLVGVQEVREDKWDTVRAEDCSFCMEKK